MLILVIVREATFSDMGIWWVPCRQFTEVHIWDKVSNFIPSHIGNLGDIGEYIYIYIHQPIINIELWLISFVFRVNVLVQIGQESKKVIIL